MTCRLPFDWEWTVHGLVVNGMGVQPGKHFATPIEKALIERVEALSEATERARLLIHMLPVRLDGCKTPSEASHIMQRDLYEAESALHYVLTGKEAVSEHSEQDSNVSGGF